MRNLSSWLGSRGSSTGSSDFNNCYPRNVSKHKAFDGMVAMGSRTFNFLEKKKKVYCRNKMAHKKDNCDYKSVETATCCYPTDENH